MIKEIDPNRLVKDATAIVDKGIAVAKRHKRDIALVVVTAMMVSHRANKTKISVEYVNDTLCEMFETGELIDGSGNNRKFKFLLK